MNIYDVFISYRRSDGIKEAEALYRYLTSKGLRVFFDKHEMIDGHYFTTQIEKNIKIAPNYILVATDDVFKFRDGIDWVRKEIEVAIEEYESKPTERTLTVLVPETVNFPEKEYLPKSICNIADVQRIPLPYGENFAEPFHKILKAVTNINRRNLWFAAHRWLENSKKPCGRFASLNIYESILPNAYRNMKEHKEMPINVYSKGKQNKSKQSLFDAMGSSNNHLYLIGQGGIGKTTALMHIMNSAYVDRQYSESTQIPIFVELSFAPDTYGALYEGGKSSFIRRSIYKQVRADRTIKQITTKEISDVDEVFASLPYEVAVQPITDILSKTSPAPEYLLLLDGLNEVSSVMIEETGLSVVQMITREIDLLLTECPNVRVVLTSRSDESAICNNSISRLYLLGIEEKTIKEYLENCDFSKELIDKVLEDENLNETLQIPLFLTMFALLLNIDEVSTQGEILKLFFNERLKNISVYTMQERLASIEKNVTDIASAVQKNRIEADMQNFILDFILPEIAWNMERNDEFYLRVRDIRNIIEPILTDMDDLAVCGEFGREIFSKYRNGASTKMHTYKVAKKILERLGDNITEVTESIVNCCVFSLGIMQESHSKYGFVHQHIRDYFAAVKNINTIRLSVYLYEEGEKELAIECMNKTFKDKPVDYTVRKFIGEYLGEHRNRPFLVNGNWNYGVPTEKCDRSLIKRAINIYRGYFNGECGYGVYSLVEIVKISRTDLSGFDFSELDLKQCSLNGIRLERNKLPACFFNAKVDETVFFNNINQFNIEKVVYDNNGCNMFIMCDDGFVRILDAETLKIIGKLEIGKSIDLYDKLFISSDNTKILVFVKGERIQIWDIATLELISYIGSKNRVIDADYNPAKDLLLTLDSDGFKLWSLQSRTLLDEFRDNSIRKAVLSKSGEYILLTHFDNTELSVVSRDSLQTIKKLKIGFDKSVVPLDNNSIVVFDASCLEVIDIIKSETLFEINEHNARLFEKHEHIPGHISHLIGAVAVNSDCNCLLIGSREIYNKTTVWNISKKEYIGELTENVNFPNGISDINSPKFITFSPNGNIIVTIGWNGTMRFWDSRTMALFASFNNAVKYGSKVIGCSSDDKMISFASKDDILHVFDIDSHRCIGSVDIDRISAIAYSEDNRFIFVGTEIGQILVLNSQTLECISSVNYNLRWVNSFHISEDKKYITVCFDIATLIFDDIQFKKPLWKFELDSCYRMYYAQLSPDNTMLLTSQADGAYIWDTKTQRLIHHIKQSFDSNNYAVFAPDGKTIATFTDYNGVDIWNIKDMNNIECFDNDFVINDIAYDNKGKYLAVVSSSYDVEIRDAHTYKLMKSLRIDSSGGYIVMFADDDKYLVATTSNDEIKIWETESFESIKTFKLVPGLMVSDIDISHLHAHSRLDDVQKHILKQYGAII